ncbi:MAG: hypothetical protein GY832_11880 [Chloroflexi bacterium]|nr:hypothetical protein [Chloroflexota bacterium]
MMTEQTELVLYHKCGRTVVQDADGAFRASDGTSILVCPSCGAVLRDRDLYGTKSDIARDKLHDVGWYPDPDSLALMENPTQRATIVSVLEESLSQMGNADLLAVYAVIMALAGDSA